MTYEQTLYFLFNRVQSFHNVGATAYKPGLEKALRLSEKFGNPHTKFKTIHVGGTNGKGSTSHSLASVLSAAGLKTGLFTSPHLVDFSERIRIDGKPIDPLSVQSFVETFLQQGLENLDPSFFELTTIMAFDYFARNNVDVAVIEVGLGGRLDTTNIINPELSVITNISYDHTALLGNSLAEIAMEKAGIIKPGVPAVIGRRNEETDPIFSQKGENVIFAEDNPLYSEAILKEDSVTYFATTWGDVNSDLTGECQSENMQTILTALNIIREKNLFPIDDQAVKVGLANVCARTGLTGRWTKFSDSPETILDTAHNVDGWKYIVSRLKNLSHKDLIFVLGFVNDKDYGKILSMLPRDASYIFVKPSVNRGEDPQKISDLATKFGIRGQILDNVEKGYQRALQIAAEKSAPFIYVGGSNFVIADFLKHFPL